MLSSTDLIDDAPHFRSIGHFVSALLSDAGRILNSGGYVSDQVGDETLVPLRHLG